MEEISYFGEIALISKDHKRIADVIAIEICLVYRLDRKVFMSCVASDKHVMHKLEILANARTEQTNLIDELHQKSIIERLTKRRYATHKQNKIV